MWTFLGGWGACMYSRLSRTSPRRHSLLWYRGWPAHSSHLTFLICFTLCCPRPQVSSHCMVFFPLQNLCVFSMLWLPLPIFPFDTNTSLKRYSLGKANGEANLHCIPSDFVPLGYGSLSCMLISPSLSKNKSLQVYICCLISHMNRDLSFLATNSSLQFFSPQVFLFCLCLHVPYP